VTESFVPVKDNSGALQPMKDNFSAQAGLYAAFRPKYPKALYDFLYTRVKHFSTALDVATGNGQVAEVLSQRFTTVYATDISEKQLSYAPQKDNIVYKVEAAEHTSFPDACFDLITVAQAIHWFNFDAFFKEVKRILKPGAIFAAIGYGVMNVNDQVDPWLNHVYHDVTGPYWDKERSHIEEGYRTIPFPFKLLETPGFAMEYKWSKEQFIGYLNTWSAVQHYIRQRQAHPFTEALLKQLDDVWPEGVTNSIRFPLLLKVGVNE